MAWIESHQALGHHPKTLALAAALHCSLPAAVGYLQYLWWWALDYAQDGVVKALAQPVAARACQWRGQPERFWSALVDAGFADIVDREDRTAAIHDWADYAGRLVEKRAANAERMRTARAAHVTRTSGARASARAGATNQPTNQPTTGLVGEVKAPGPAAREPGPGGPLALAQPAPDDPMPLPNGAKQCPLCPEVFTGTYDEHLAASARHKVRPEPEDFGRRRISNGTPPAEQPVERPALNVDNAVRAEHERLLAVERKQRTPRPSA